MNTPYSIIRPPKDMTNCGAQMTSSGGGVVTRSSVGSLFQTENEVQVIAYGNNPPTEKERSGTGDGFGFQINKTGYYDIYGGFRYGGDFVSTQGRMGFQFENSSGDAIDVDAATEQRTVPYRWLTTTGGSGGNNIARINDFVHCGIRLNDGDSVYFVGNPLSGQQVKAYQSTLFFSVKYIGDDPQLIG